MSFRLRFTQERIEEEETGDWTDEEDTRPQTEFPFVPPPLVPPRLHLDRLVPVFDPELQLDWSRILDPEYYAAYVDSLRSPDPRATFSRAPILKPRS